ncbi:protein disulfide-isomerase [Desulfosarcina ovata subsp. sediminis]|uniref:Protein disulfide-isomerase n=1 Tax=Desulfosarcina ovata subsp. sediminis TaxID=885957 RepID=A0A5K7ZZB5_9BACT|nr:thioredoxin fold domain-containing protein [Desulfosarcina ovata]BBO85481.1 protein disulfide-isomerase [Desulfosarcina ovata subsp. sediminis]
MNKKQTLTAVVLILVTAVLGGRFPVEAAQAGDGIQWMSYDEGRRKGEDKNKKVFMVFSADGCRFCHQMEKETFQNPAVIAYVNRTFIPVSVDLARQQNIAAKYGVQGVPSTWFISENGERIGSRPGYIPADEMLKILKYVGSDSYLTMSFQAFLEKSP